MLQKLHRFEKKDQESTVPRPSKNVASSSKVNEEAVSLNASNNSKNNNGNEICIICGIRQKTQGVRVKLSLATDEKVKEVLPLLNDNALDEVIRKLTVSEEIMWHPKCRNGLKPKPSNAENSERSNFMKLRDAHKNAFAILIESINEEIIQNNEIGILTILHSEYLSLITEICELNNITFGHFRPTHLQNKLMKHFGETIAFQILPETDE